MMRLVNLVVERVEKEKRRAQGRQTKTKSTKKKGGKRKDEEWSDDDEIGKPGGGKGGKGKKESKKDLEFKSCPELENSIRSMPQLSDFPDEVFTELSEILVDQLNRKYREA